MMSQCTVLTGDGEFATKRIVAAPCSVRRESILLKEPIPVLREIRSRRAGNAYAVGLSDASNDYPPCSNGFSSKGSLTAQVEGSQYSQKACSRRPFLMGRPFNHSRSRNIGPIGAKLAVTAWGFRT